MRKFFVRALCVLSFFNSFLLSAQITNADQWTWVRGGPGASAANYGTQGVSNPSNTPGGRSAYSSWTDPSGRLYFFGGGGLDRNSTNGYMSDVWRFDRATATWTWLNGSDLVNKAPVYGTKGLASTDGNPGSRGASAFWQTSDGTAWIYGGGAHHTSFSQNLTSMHMRDFADMAGIECVVIDKDTDLNAFRNELRWNEVYYRNNH
jgi:hypothetical protein